ncbi:MAG: hypothetical protein HYV03_06810 [Deltaproteobacteria bacterium]|nr:hypothetical protein [Deltaproteobacteria bacterium]
MTQAKSVRIDPMAIQQAATSPAKAKAAGVGKAAFGDFLGVAGAFAPLAGEVTYQSFGNPNAAAVLHSAFSALPAAYAAGKGGYAGSVLGDMPGAMGYPKYGSTLATGSGDLYNPGAPVADTGVTQAELIDQMNQNNLQLLELQAIMQNNMQQWTTKSNILKSVHEAKMAMIQKFTVHS